MDTEKLIQSVKKRPALYDKSNKRYGNKYFKMKMWNEVCSEVFDLEQLRKQGKSVYEMQRLLMRRWQNIRTCFARELNRRKKKHVQPDDDMSYKGRKTYSYFNQLLFLSKHKGTNTSTEDQEDVNMSDSSTEPNDSNLKEEPTEDFFVDCSANVEDNFRENTPELNDSHSSKQSNDKEFHEEECSKSVEKKEVLELLEVLKDAQKDDVDEDKQFLLSLIPSFRKLNDKQKFEAKIGILKILKNITFEK